MNEGDTMQLGGSSRFYRLHWVPLSRAYDMENPFMSPLDVSGPIEEGGGGGTDQVRVFFLFFCFNWLEMQSGHNVFV